MKKKENLVIPEGLNIPLSLLAFIDLRIEDGNLTEKDADAIIGEVKERQRQNPLSEEELNYLLEYTDARLREKVESKPVPTMLRVLGVVGLVVGVATLAKLVFLALGITFFTFDFSLLEQYSATFLIVVGLEVVVSVLYTIGLVVLSVRLLRNKRRGSAVMLHVLAALAAVDLILVIMIGGINTNIIVPIIQALVCVVVSSYLDANLRQERRLSYLLGQVDTETRAKQGTLGLDLTGKGYIKLDFFNLFWIFVVCCFVGEVVEIAFHMIVVEPGVFQERAGLLYGPFSPIYGFGALLMTIALNRFRKANILVVFLVCTVIGGAFEYFVSVFMEVGFGVTAWDYSDQWLGWLFNGRTCPLYAAMFGVLGLVWIKLLMPVILKVINKFPWQWRYTVTAICGVLMAINAVMTLQALDCWYERVSGKTPETPIELFYAEHYDDQWMANRFQSMTVHPDNAARGGDVD